MLIFQLHEIVLVTYSKGNERLAQIIEVRAVKSWGYNEDIAIVVRFYDNGEERRYETRKQNQRARIRQATPCEIATHSQQ